MRTLRASGAVPVIATAVFAEMTSAPTFGVPVVVRGITFTASRLPTFPAVTVHESLVDAAAQLVGVSPVAGYSHH